MSVKEFAFSNKDLIMAALKPEERQNIVLFWRKAKELFEASQNAMQQEQEQEEEDDDEEDEDYDPDEEEEENGDIQWDFKCIEETGPAGNTLYFVPHENNEESLSLLKEMCDFSREGLDGTDAPNYIREARDAAEYTRNKGVRYTGPSFRLIDDNFSEWTVCELVKKKDVACVEFVLAKGVKLHLLPFKPTEFRRLTSHEVLEALGSKMPYILGVKELPQEESR